MRVASTYSAPQKWITCPKTRHWSVGLVRVLSVEQPLALYRRYRPETFAEVVGQDHVTGPLRQALANNRVNHAYLFSGPRGCGKTTSARILARALNCEKAPISDPCGECQSCRDLARGGPGSLDVIEIDAASHGGVDDARDLRERAFFAPVSSRYKVYIIDEAHMVTPQGFNALLKLVEEPPEHLKFIFATTAPDKVLGTIRSRTHHYPFRLIPPRTLSDYLATLCEAEGVHIDNAALPLVVRAGAGSARDSLSVLDQLIGGAGPDGVTYEVAAALLGYTPDSLLDEVIDAMSEGDGGTVFGVVDKVIEIGQDPRRFTEDLLRRLRDLVIMAAAPDSARGGLLEVSDDAADRLSAQAARFGRAELVRAADVVAAGLTEMRGATAPRLLLELICARLLLPGADDSALGFGARIDRLERRISASGMPAPSAAAFDSPPATPAGARAALSAATAQAPVAQTPTTQAPTPEQPAPTPEPPSAVSPAPVKPTTGQPTPARPTPAEPAPTDTNEPTVPLSPPAKQPTARQAPPAPAAPPVASEPTKAAPPGALSQADVRRLWPDVLDRVRTMKRFTWMLLSQNSQVVGIEANVLTLGFKTAGARESFLQGGSDQILRQAMIDLIGADWRIEAVVDPSADPVKAAAPRVIKPAVVDAPPASPAAASRPPAPAPPPEAAQGPEAEPIDPDDYVDPADPTISNEAESGAALLARELGATVIEEIPHDK